MSKPYISVIVTAYNRTQFIYQAINSVLEQSIDKDAYEIIVVSNFPLDSTFVSHHRIRTVNCDEEGLGIKIKLGLEIACGEVISILDDDDFWESERLAVVSQLFRSRPDVGFFHNWFTLVDVNGAQLNTSFRSAVTKRWNAVKSYELDPKSIKYRQIRRAVSYSIDFYSSLISFRREIVAGRESELGSIYGSTDVFYFYSCLASTFKLRAVSERLTNYRIHPSNISAAGSTANGMSQKKSRFTLAVINDYKSILKMVSGTFSPAVEKALKWRISGTELESIWLSFGFSRRRLLRSMATYLKYISIHTLRYDISVLAYSFLYLVGARYARRVYQER